MEGWYLAITEQFWAFDIIKNLDLTITIALHYDSMTWPSGTDIISCVMILSSHCPPANTELPSYWLYINIGVSPRVKIKDNVSAGYYKANVILGNGKTKTIPVFLL